MNKGTASKWIDLIESGHYKFGNGQLRFENMFCPLGILADFLDKDGWKNDYIGMVWHGEKFKLPEFARKKCKIKTPYLNFKTDNGKDLNLCDIIDESLNYEIPIYYIKKYFEQF